MNTRIVIASVIAVTGMVVAYRAFWRAVPSPGPNGSARVLGPGAGNAPAAASNDAGPLHPADLPGFDELRCKEMTAAEALIAIQDRLKDSTLWMSVRVSEQDRETLTSRFLARVNHVLEGSDEKRQAESLRDGVDPAAPPGLSAESLQRLRAWPEVWRDVPLDPARIVVRRIDYSSETTYRRSTTAATARSALQGGFKPAARGVECVELVIPCRPLTEPGGSRRVSAFLGIAYDRALGAPDWKPRCITVYTAEHPGGRPLIPPPL